MAGLLWGWDAQGAPEARIGFVHREAPHNAGAALIEDASDSHALVVAPTGAGKAVNIVIPNLLHYPGPAVVIDVKGELFDVTAAHRKRLGQEVIALDPWGVMTTKSGRFNPLDVLGESAGVDEAYSFAALLRDPHSPSKDPFWEERGENLIAGALTHLLALNDRAQRHLGAVWKFLHQEDTVFAIAAALDKFGDAMPGFARDTLAAFISVADLTRSGILSTAQSMLRVFASDEVRAAIETTDFSVADFREGKPMTIYLIVPPTKLRSHAALLRLWVAALLSVVTTRQQRPALPTLFVLDELAQLGPMEEVRTAITLARGYGLKVMMLVQSYAQLRRLYPDHETLAENCGVIATFGHHSRSMSAQMAEALGDLSTDALFRMKPNALALKMAGKETRIVRRVNYLTDPLFAGRFTENRMFAERARA